MQYLAAAAIATPSFGGAGTGTISVPEFDATAALVHSGATITGTASFLAVRAATGALVHSGATIAGTATAAAPGFHAEGGVTVGKATSFGSVTFNPVSGIQGNAVLVHSGATFSGVATFQTKHQGTAALAHSGATISGTASFLPGGGSTTPLTQPEWLEWTEDYPGQKLGVSYDPVTEMTNFVETNVLVATSDAQWLSHVATAKSNSAIDAIHLDPTGGPYSYPNNLLAGVTRPLDRPLVIRTQPGFPGQQAEVGAFIGAGNPGALDNGNPQGLAFVDVYFPGGYSIVGAGYGLLFEGCTGWLTVQGISVPSSNPRQILYPFSNVQIRKCTMCDHWASGSSVLVHGLFAWGVDGLLLEANFFDHNGWNPAVDRNEDKDLGTGGATFQKHNIYTSRQLPNQYARYNKICRGSSHGLHSKDGCHARRNMFVRNPINHQVGYGNDNLWNTFGVILNTSCIDNVFLGTDNINTADNQLRGTAIWVVCCAGVTVSGNLTIDAGVSNSNVATFYIEQNYPTQFTIDNHRGKGWTPINLYRNGSTYPANITRSDEDHYVTLTPAVQALADYLKMDSTLDLEKVAVKGYGVNIAQLKFDMDTIRAGVTPAFS